MPDPALKAAHQLFAPAFVGGAADQSPDLAAQGAGFAPEPFGLIRHTGLDRLDDFLLETSRAKNPDSQCGQAGAGHGDVSGLGRRTGGGSGKLL